MKNYKFLVLFLLVSITIQASTFSDCGKVRFDTGWKFFRGDIDGAEKPSFNDQSWRNIDLPHDWSIEKLPNQESGKVVGPFSKESIGSTATGYTVGGTAWYRKTFVLNADRKCSKTFIVFDGVYMNCVVWINGRKIGSHYYGYTPFCVDITSFLNSSGKQNVLAVKVMNEGKNSRWYSGSGIYRHVWLIRKQNVHFAWNGVCIVTNNASSKKAVLKISAIVNKSSRISPNVKLSISLMDSDRRTLKKVETPLYRLLKNRMNFVKYMTVVNPRLWSVDTPSLYTLNAKIISDGIVTDSAFLTFGIRTIHFDSKTGFTLNGNKVLLKGGCMHQDNGFLGTAAIDRAEERRVELMKSYGFNAIRTSHNPPSEQFLNACDRNGILVIDEAFDMWERAKNPQDYHLYFDKCWKKDLESMVLRDRNHPSVIMWSIGNEINERADSIGYVITKKLVNEIKSLDVTRPVTEAICGFWDHAGQNWSTTAPTFASLDVGGYNYLCDKYDADHAIYPNRIMMGTESYPGDIFNCWMHVENDPWVIGDFVWTAMDYLGETGVGNTNLDNGPRMGLKQWPYFNSFCGDIDLCGFKKPQMFYRNVVWGDSKLEMAVHRPIPSGKKETVSYWGWPDEMQSWTWNVEKGRIMNVRVFSSCPRVRIELNGRIISEKPNGKMTQYISEFKVPYEPGVLKAVGLDNGTEVASKEFITAGTPAIIKLVADRTDIKADRNDLSYVKIEVLDVNGNLVPDAQIPVTFTASGAGEIAGSGNACPYDMESFDSSICKTFHGKALVILRPLKDNKSGVIVLKAKSNGLTSGEVSVIVK